MKWFCGDCIPNDVSMALFLWRVTAKYLVSLRVEDLVV